MVGLRTWTEKKCIRWTYDNGFRLRSERDEKCEMEGLSTWAEKKVNDGLVTMVIEWGMQRKKGCSKQGNGLAMWRRWGGAKGLEIRLARLEGKGKRVLQQSTERIFFLYLKRII